MIVKPPIFFSYAWGDENEKGVSREKIVNDLYESLLEDKYDVKRDKYDLEYRGFISEFIGAIGRGKCIVVAISQKYVRSHYCMFELYEIARNSNFNKHQFRDKVFPIMVEFIDFAKPDVIKEFFEYWEKEYSEWSHLIQHWTGMASIEQMHRFDKIKMINQNIGKLMDWLIDMNTLSLQTLSNDNFARIKDAIEVQAARQQAEFQSERAEEQTALREEADQEKNKAISAKTIAKRNLRLARMWLILFVIVAAIAVAFAIDNARKKKKVNQALTEVRKVADKNKKLIDAFYFYKNRLALAYKGKKFGFIDKEGNLRIQYLYDVAEGFDYTGYAKVKREENKKLTDFLIDSGGNEFKVAYKIKDLRADIKALDLRDQEIEGLPKKIFSQRQLKVLLCRGNYNHLKKEFIIPDSLFALDSLETLALVSFGIRKIPDEIGRLKNLTGLWFSDNKGLKSIPPDIEKLTELESLDLSGSDSLITIPTQIGKLNKLRNLYLSGCKNLDSLPSEILQLINLNDIVVHGTAIKTFPSNIDTLTNLKILFLSENKNLKRFPSKVWKLVNLESLNLGGTDLSQSPPSLYKLTKLRELNLENTNIESVPEEIDSLVDLTDLYLAGNKNLKSLPASIWNLINLTVFVLGRSGIRNIDSIGNLINLTTLYLDSLNLTSLPDGIEKLTSLTTLELENNNFPDIPSAILKLKNLRVLYLRGNKRIRNIPPDFDRMINLKELHLTGTAIPRGELQSLEKSLPNCKIYY